MVLGMSENRIWGCTMDQEIKPNPGRLLGIIEFFPLEVVVRGWRTPTVPAMRRIPLRDMSTLEVVERTEWGWEVTPSFRPDGKIRGRILGEVSREEEYEYGVPYSLFLDESRSTKAGEPGVYHLLRAY